MKLKEIKKLINEIEKDLTKPYIEKVKGGVRLNRMSDVMKEHLEKRKRELMIEYLYYKESKPKVCCDISTKIMEVKR